MGLADVGVFLSLVSGLGYSLGAFLGLYDLYGMYDLLTLIDFAGGCDLLCISHGGVPYFGTRVWFTECFDVKSYCFAIWIVC